MPVSQHVGALRQVQLSLIIKREIIIAKARLVPEFKQGVVTLKDRHVRRACAAHTLDKRVIITLHMGDIQCWLRCTWQGSRLGHHGHLGLGNPEDGKQAHSHGLSHPEDNITGLHDSVGGAHPEMVMSALDQGAKVDGIT
jgi:hypothetical protein